MREQQKSKLIRKGEGTAHIKAKTRLVNILIDNGWEVFPDAIFSNRCMLMSQNDIPLLNRHTCFYYHEFDIYAIKDHGNGLASQLIIEIDGSSHNSKVQQGKDRTAEAYAHFFLPDAIFRRIPIDELIGRRRSTNKEIIEDHIIERNAA